MKFASKECPHPVTIRDSALQVGLGNSWHQRQRVVEIAIKQRPKLAEATAWKVKVLRAE